MPKKIKLHDLIDIKGFLLCIIVIAIIGYFISVYTKLNFLASFGIILGSVLINGVVIDLLGDKDH